MTASVENGAKTAPDTGLPIDESVDVNADVIVNNDDSVSDNGDSPKPEDDIKQDGANDNTASDEKEIKNHIIEVRFQTKGRFVYFTTEDEHVAEVLRRYSELLLKNAHDPDTGEFDQEKLPKSTELKDKILEHFKEQEEKDNIPKIYYSRLTDISSDTYKNAKLEDVIPNYPHPDKVAKRSIELEKESKKSVKISTALELGSTMLFVGLAFASGDATFKKIALTFGEAMFVLVPLAHSYKLSNNSINAHETALQKFEETGDESAFDGLGTGLQTRVPYQHHSHDSSILGAVKESFKESATVAGNPYGIYKDWKNPYNYGVIGGAIRNVYLLGIQAKTTGKVIKENAQHKLEQCNTKVCRAAFKAYNWVTNSDVKPKEPITTKAPPVKPADHIKFIFLPGPDGKNRRVIRTEMPSHSNISAITTSADTKRMANMISAAKKSWWKAHTKIATGLVGIGAAGLFCYNIAPYVGKSFKEAANTGSPVDVGVAKNMLTSAFDAVRNGTTENLQLLEQAQNLANPESMVAWATAGAWGLTIAMGAAAAKHFMQDREKIHVELQSKQAFAAFKDQARAHLINMRHEFTTKVHEAVDNQYVTPKQFDDIIQAYRKLPVSELDEETRDMFERFFPRDEEGRRTTTLFSSSPIEPSPPQEPV